MYNYDLNLYKIFYYVAKYKSFTKAAEVLYITQPAISQSIKKLEKQLKVELFQRTNKGIELTDAGKIVYSYAEQLNAFALSSNNLIEKIEGLNSKEIKIGVPTHNSYLFIGENISELCKKYKNVKITIVNDTMYQMMKMLEKREIDILLGSNLTSNLKSIQIDNIFNVELCFVVSNTYDIPKKEFTLNELNEYPLILPTDETSNRKMLDLIANKYHIDKLNAIVDCNSSTICKKLVLSDLGVAWMKRDIVQSYLDKGRMIEVNVNMDQLQIPFSIAYNKDFLTEQQEYFINLFKNM